MTMGLRQSLKVWRREKVAQPSYPSLYGAGFRQVHSLFGKRVVTLSTNGLGVSQLGNTNPKFQNRMGAEDRHIDPTEEFDLRCIDLVSNRNASSGILYSNIWKISTWTPNGGTGLSYSTLDVPRLRDASSIS